MRFVERYALTMTEAGLPRMPARVFACILVDDDGRLTAGQLAERLGVSRAAISGAVRYLIQVGILHRQREPGERVDHYSFQTDQWYEMYASRDDVLKRWEEMSAEGAEMLGDRPAARRLHDTREFFAFMRTQLPQVVDRWREHREQLDRRRASSSS